MTSTAALLLQADRLRPRSQQREIGISDLGTCRKRTGYKLAGYEPVNTTGSVQAVIGSAVHDMVAAILTDRAVPGDLVEHEITFAGITGHLDRYEADTATVVDVKTTSTRWMEHLRLHGPDHNHLWQVSVYGAGLAMEGHEVQRVRIDYLARDTGEEYQWPSERGARFNIQHVRDAMDWLKQVRDAPLDLLPRDYEPDSVFCQGCPFGGPDGGICWENSVVGRDLRSALFVEDPDAEKWMAQLWQARNDGRAAKEIATRATGALSALMPPEPNQPVEAGGWGIAWNVRGVIRFTATPDDVKTGAA